MEYFHIMHFDAAEYTSVCHRRKFTIKMHAHCTLHTNIESRFARVLNKTAHTETARQSPQHIACSMHLDHLRWKQQQRRQRLRRQPATSSTHNNTTIYVIRNSANADNARQSV